MKGISLSLETIVLLILMTVVLGALILFFLGTFTPAQKKFDLIKQKESLCLQYIAKDSKCNPEAVKRDNEVRYTSDLKPILQNLFTNVCNKPSGDPVCSGGTDMPTGSCLQSCCAIQCGQKSSQPSNP